MSSEESLPPSQRRDRPFIEMDRVVKVYKTPAGEFSALKGISPAFWQGEFVSVVGKSGSGKSTLANMITGIDHPTSGDVRVGDTIITRMKEGQMAAWRGRTLGIVFQFFQLLPMLTLLENVLLPMDFCNTWVPEEREQRALDLLKMVGLDTLADKMPAEVSGGQQQATAVARALANDPPVIIADEPTGNLDSRTADTVFNIFVELAQRGKTILMVTHDKSLAERTTRSLLLFDGELINETVAQALPSLPHRQMLWLTKTLGARMLGPGEELSLVENGPLGLIIVEDACVEMVARDRNNRETASLLLDPRSVITVQEGSHDPTMTFSLRAPLDRPARLLVLERACFGEWIGQPGPAGEIARKVAFEQAAALRIDPLLRRRS